MIEFCIAFMTGSKLMAHLENQGNMQIFLIMKNNKKIQIQTNLH